MKKLIVASSVLATSVAFAGDYKFNVEARSDLIMNTNKTTVQAGTSTETKETSFKNNLVRLNMLAVVNDSLSFRFRQRFTKTSTDSARDTSSDMTDFVYADHKNSYFTTRFGKQSWSEAYGRESFVSGSDQIITSAVKADYNSTVGEYRFGVSAIVKPMDGQTVTVALANPNKTLTASTGAKKNNSVAMGLYYNGAFMGKMLQPTFGYTLAPQDGDTEAATGSKTKKVNYTLMALGLRSEVAGAVIDVDYKTLKRPDSNDGTNTSVLNKTKETKSMYANVGYAIDSVTPFVAYINDKYTTSDTTTAAAQAYKKTSLAVGAMWKPMADVNFRYHLIYTSAKTEWSGTVATNKEVKDSNIVLGFKADI